MSEQTEVLRCSGEGRKWNRAHIPSANTRTGIMGRLNWESKM